MILDGNWIMPLDGHAHAVRATYSLPESVLAVYVDDVLACTKTIWLVSPGEFCRFKKDGHEYVVSKTGWIGFGSLELKVDGLEAERTSAGPAVAPTSVVKCEVSQEWREQHVELVETQRIEEPLGEERRVIDNSHSNAAVQRKMTVSKQWSQRIAIDEETATAVKGEAGAKVFVNLKLEAERRIQEKYSTSTETRKTYSEEVVITVPARTKIELVFAWKQVWQCGIIRVHARDGSISELPYRLCLDATFDQRQVESAA
jgi:hypothetical protein